MKHNFARTHFLTLSAVVVSGLPLHAAEPMAVRWNDVCSATRGHQLTLTTANGHSVDGYCISVDVEEIAVTTKDQRVVKIARTALSRIRMRSSKKGHQLNSLGRGVHEGLRLGFDWLLSPLAPLGAVTVPATLAWGVVAAPFCILGDLKDNMATNQEIKVI